ncbi:hypothetical protein [Bradyrhizobium sp. 18]|uniref:hypothetical protein n=1 Tax=Bradyrhizobium sp. 18 TaxID=2782657 RepID=UPI001FFB7157|nr:hypothetical protein [Bradyrhizobium sp. 18]MCK1507185.1 hypothetical protein [Bradyrhizobium sp. 18]
MLKTFARLSEGTILQRLSQSEIGRKMLDEAHRETIDRRRELVTIIRAAEAEATKELAKIEPEGKKIAGEIVDLANKLKAAQVRQGDLKKQVHAVKAKRFDAVKAATDELSRSAPQGLHEFIALVRFIQLGVSFRLRRQPGTLMTVDSRSDMIAKRPILEAQLRRAEQVLPKALALIKTPDADEAAIARLRDELRPLPEYVEHAESS